MAKPKHIPVYPGLRVQFVWDMRTQNADVFVVTGWSKAQYYYRIRFKWASGANDSIAIYNLKPSGKRGMTLADPVTPTKVVKRGRSGVTKAKSAASRRPSRARR